MASRTDYSIRFLNSAFGKAKTSIKNAYSAAAAEIKKIEQAFLQASGSTLTLEEAYKKLLVDRGSSDIGQLVGVIDLFRELKTATAKGLKLNSPQTKEMFSNLQKELKNLNNEEITKAVLDNPDLNARALGNIAEPLFVNVFRSMLDKYLDGIVGDSVRQITNPQQKGKTGDAVVNLLNQFNFAISFKTGLTQNKNKQLVDAFTVTRSGSFEDMANKGVKYAEDIIHWFDTDGFFTEQVVIDLETAIAWFYVLSGVFGKDVPNDGNVNFTIGSIDEGAFPLFLMSQNKMVPVTNLLGQLQNTSMYDMYGNINQLYSKFPFDTANVIEMMSQKKDSMMRKWGNSQGEVTRDTVGEKLSVLSVNDIKEVIRSVYEGNDEARQRFKTGNKRYFKSREAYSIEQDYTQDLISDILVMYSDANVMLNRTLSKMWLHFSVSYSIVMQNAETIDT